MDIKKRIEKKLVFLYGKERGRNAAEELIGVLDNFKEKKKSYGLSQKDSILITYGDSISKRGEKTLKTLNRFATKRLKGSINTIHLLPFFPYGLDRGFSVKDFYTVAPWMGNWKDIEKIRKNFPIMVDFVVNHLCSDGVWFKAFARGDERYKDFFIAFDPKNKPSKKQLQKVFRPRTNSLLVPFKTNNGRKLVWSTFLNDQVDLNYANERVLIETMKVILFYIKEGADLIRLDAIAFLWKKLGTSCLHLKQVHVYVQLVRDVLKAVAPHVVIITETNVPHKENISYFGNGNNEAHMVYNFSLPPLVVQAVQSGNAKHLTKWAKILKKKGNTTFFNFLDSHDGIAVGPLEGIVSDKEIADLVDGSLRKGGKVGYKVVNGKKKPYEMNITWWSILEDEKEEDIQIKRYLLSRSIALSLRGVPGIYINGLLGNKNDTKGFNKTKHNRDMNRENLKEKNIEKEMKNKNSRMSKIFYPYAKYIRIRSKHKAFHPEGEQKILNLGKELFALERISPDKKERILCVHNVSDKEVVAKGKGKDLISGRRYSGKIKVEPYQFLWLKK